MRVRLGVIVVAILALSGTVLPTAAGAQVPLPRVAYTLGAAYADPGGRLAAYPYTADAIAVGVELKVPDVPRGHRIEVWASRGPQELVLVGTMVRKCVSDGGAAAAVPFGCYRHFFLKFGSRAGRKVRLVEKNARTRAETQFMLANPHHEKVLTKFLVAHTQGRLRSLAQAIRSAAARVPAEHRSAAFTQLAHEFYECGGFPAMKVVRAAALASTSYASVMTRAQWVRLLSLTEAGTYPVFAGVAEGSGTHAYVEGVAAPCLACGRTLLDSLSGGRLFRSAVPHSQLIGAPLPADLNAAAHQAEMNAAGSWVAPDR